jgi:spermidine/putrescine-binding protein
MIVDSPEDVLPSVLIYLGKDPNSHDPAEWTAADVLMQIRPFVQEAIKNDPAIYPDAKTRAKLSIETMQPPELKRLMRRLWTRFRTGQ